MVTIPKNVPVYDEPGGVWWINEEGILYFISKKDAPKTTKEENEKQIHKLNEFFGGEKICLMPDINYIKPFTKQEREEISIQLEKIVKAMAILSTMPLSWMVARLFLGLKPPSYPVKIFNNETEAKKWIKQYL